MRSTPFKKLDPVVLERWSPRAFSRAAIDPETLDTLFEAARWSPSCFNEQPWFFLVTDTPGALERMQPVILDGNRTWADQAPVLTLLFARRSFTKGGKPNRWAGFDTGAAWMSLATQAARLGLITHAMGGFSGEKALEVAGLDPAEWEAMAAIAIGRPGDPAELNDNLRSREEPSDRLPLDRIRRRLT